MARYKDCDKCYHRLVCAGDTDKWNYYGECPHYINAADVVAKSEVERLQAEAECLRNANADLALALLYECEPTKEHFGELEKAVRDKVARDIFEEIEREIEEALKSNYKVLPQFEQSCELWNRVSGKIDALRGIEGFIAELKRNTGGDQNEEKKEDS